MNGTDMRVGMVGWNSTVRVDRGQRCRRQGLLAAVAMVALGTTSAATAQTAPPSDGAGPNLTADQSTPPGETGVQDIVVTARKRTERLLDVPVAVTAISAEAIDAQGITSLADIANVTPGLTLDSTVGGSGRNDRSFPEYIIRGMVPSSQSNPTTTVFIDNAPVPSGQIDAVDDVERVEVLKGPQSAYFGRETFAGAINVITKDPSDEFHGSINGLVGSRDYTDFRATVEGPIIPGVIDARLSLRSYSISGSYRNKAADGTKGSNDETLGDQSTKSGSLQIVARPTEDLKIKLNGILWNDDDGPSAQGLITSAQSNCTFPATGVSYFCGTTPGLIGNTPAANTRITNAIDALLHNRTTNPLTYELYNPSDFLNHYGLNRDAYHVSLGFDYALPSLGVTISSITTTDKQEYAEIQDLDNADTSTIPAFSFIPGNQPFFDWPFIVENRYRSLDQDFRIVSDADQPFRWTLGVSYDWVRNDEALISGGPFGPASFLSGSSEAETVGGYFALAYDILDGLTLNFEGRLQADKQVAYNGNSASVNVSRTYRDFLPRVSLQYKPLPDLMTYFTYSEGVNPGSFNTTLEALTPAQQAQALSQLGATIEVRPEHLKNFELGLKGQFFDRRLTFAGDIYYDKWTNQIELGDFTEIVNGIPDLFAESTNNNESTLKGIELDASAVPVQHLTITASFALNDTRFDHAFCGTCVLISGVQTVSGTQLPNVSKYQAAFGVEYTDPLYLLDGWDWFARADFSYKSGVYDLPANYVRTPDRTILDLRAGIRNDNVRVEFFVENATNDGHFTNTAPTALLASPTSNFSTPNTLVVGLPRLLTYGVRAKYSF